MKIGHYTLNIWEPGGVASYIRRVSEMQRRNGHEVFYFDAITPPPQAERKKRTLTDLLGDIFGGNN